MTAQDLDVVRGIKEKLGFVVGSWEEAKSAEGVEENYELPDGRKIVVGKERCMVPEIMF